VVESVALDRFVVQRVASGQTMVETVAFDRFVVERVALGHFWLKK
jgi:hypothetical protein